MTLPPLYNPEDVPFILQALIDYWAIWLAWSMMWYLRGKNNWLKKTLLYLEQKKKSTS